MISRSRVLMVANTSEASRKVMTAAEMNSGLVFRDKSHSRNGKCTKASNAALKTTNDNRGMKLVRKALFEMNEESFSIIVPSICTEPQPQSIKDPHTSQLSPPFFWPAKYSWGSAGFLQA